MKKFLSLILVAIMLVTAMPIAFAEGETYKVGDIVQFGSYPQSEVKDQTLLLELNKLAPAWDNWINYGYYWDVDGAMTQTSWMRYTDVEYGGNKYRGVSFIKYRGENIEHPEYFGMLSHQDDNGYFYNMTYWFKFEPIEWRVLDPETGFVMSEIILDAQPFSNTFYGDANEGWFNDIYHTNYANDYETSNIRKWLNEDFYNVAFIHGEKNEIAVTTLNNDAEDIFREVFYDRNETNDKIFLLSREDVLNEDFCEFGTIEDEIPKAKGSDYAKCQGLYVWQDPGSIIDGTSNWYLRTGDNSTGQVYFVEGSSVTVWVQDASYGVRPALKFNDINNLSNEHDYTAKVYAPTCTTQGYTTYTCDCGDTYVGDYVGVVPHIDTDSDYKCDYGCGYEFEKPEVKLNFFQKIIQWFKDLFSKLFGWMK